MKFPKFELPIRTALLYLLFGGLWILLSDSILLRLVPDSEKYPLLQTLKGWFFILINGALLYSLLLRDYQERKRAEVEILSLSRFPAENPNPVLRVAPHGKMLYANQAGATLFGFGDPQVNQQLPDEWKKYTAEALASGLNQEHEIELDGQIFSCTIVPVKAAGYINIYASDITQRRQAEQNLHLHSAALNVAANGIVITDREGTIVWVNPAFTTLTGYTLLEVMGKNPRELVKSGQHDQAVYRQLWDTILSGKVWSGELINRRKDGSYYNEEQIITPLLDAQGKIAYFIAIKQDITERKRAEQTIEHQVRRLNGLRAIDMAISSSFDVSVTLDVVLQQVLSQLGVDAAAILLFNPREQTIEYKASRGFHSEALHHTQLKLSEGYAGHAVREHGTIHIPDLLDAGGKLAKALQQAGENFVDYYGTVLITKGEVKGVLEIYHHSLIQHDAEWLDFLETLAGQAAIAIDSAQLFENLQRSNIELEHRVMQRTMELNQTNIKLEHANRAKDEFLATMSHELRTPLNSILGLSETLLEQRRDPLSAYQQKSLQTIASSGEHLLELINDILDLSKIEAGKFDYYPQIIGVDDLCRSSLAFVKEQATRKSITLTYRLETTVSKMYADPRRLKQTLVNLLTNAVKFTPDNGYVILRVHGNAEQDRIQFSVIDTGIGIAPEDMENLFQPFVQVDSRLTREYEGTGLGLALVQKLTDLHGGSVDVESEVGKGSRFTINLSIGQAMLEQPKVIESNDKLSTVEQTEKTDIPTAELTDRRVILLAEDNMANILTIGDYLESHGYQVVVAHDGLSAIEQAEALQPNIILMDIQMPVLDGLEAIHILRAMPRFAATPIIALTALAMPGDRERCLEAGANEYMSKPVSLKALAEKIRELVQRGE